MAIKNEMIRRLRQDCKILMDVKIPKALENISDEKGVNTYRNLTRALADNIKLIEELEKDDYKPMWSIYETGANEGNLTPQVAVWMQNGQGEISSHQVFDIDYKIKADTINGVCNIEFDKNDKFKDFEENLKSVIDNFSVDGKIIIPTSEAVRGVGKTTFLIKQAIENNGIYVGASKNKVDYAKRIANKEFDSVLQTAFFEDDYKNCKNIKLKDTLYIDEGVDLSRIDLDGNKYVAFKYIHLNSL